ncbi:hypothetical protein ASE41_35335 [Streptomyces sp. Root264]|nr:hypothetical protein ASE41_35335 [Streptomyces sp. Root264]
MCVGEGRLAQRDEGGHRRVVRGQGRLGGGHRGHVGSEGVRVAQDRLQSGHDAVQAVVGAPGP